MPLLGAPSKGFPLGSVEGPPDRGVLRLQTYTEYRAPYERSFLTWLRRERPKPATPGGMD